MRPDLAREFVASNHRAVLTTRRPGGDCRPRPFGRVDDEGKVVISTREGADKTRNLRRDPTVVLCVLSDDFFGPWMQIEGTAQVISLPEAMEDWSTTTGAAAGSIPDWDDYGRAMQHEQRVLVRVWIDAAGPAHAG